MMPATATQPAYVTMAAALRLLPGRTHTQIRVAAALGRIRIDAPPGSRVRYHRQDLLSNLAVDQAVAAIAS
jgi:hypothetical protein